MQMMEQSSQDQVVALERELKLLKLQQKKSELEGSKSPLRTQLAQSGVFATSGKAQSTAVGVNNTSKSEITLAD